MRDYEDKGKLQEQYEGLRLRYEVRESSLFKKKNEENYQKMVDALNDVGIFMNIEDGELTLSLYPQKYIRMKHRNAGRNKVAMVKSCEGKYSYYKYSDIVYMQQTMSDQQVADQIGTPIATYYRHKKKLKESQYYKSLDMNRLHDKEYLESFGDLNLKF